MVFFILFIGMVVMATVINYSVSQSQGRGHRRSTQKAILRGEIGLTSTEAEALRLHCPYYIALNSDEKAEFERRLTYFMATKQFVAHHGLDLFDAMKALICAEAIKITFGLNKFVLPHFNVIHIYPEEYFSRATRGYHKGDVDLRGAISLSWKNIKEGIVDPTDGLNVAIHEFAHAVYFENFIKNEHYLFINPELLKQWNRLAEEEMPNVRDDDNHFIRAYGGTNTNEFFAVSTEHFFEQPKQFSEEHSELFELMVKIYNQNPMERVKTHL